MLKPLSPTFSIRSILKEGREGNRAGNPADLSMRPADGTASESAAGDDSGHSSSVAATHPCPRPAPGAKNVSNLRYRPSEEGTPSITRAFTGSQWITMALYLQAQRQLCGPLWYEGEVCVLFADTNVGKSLLAVQIADMISRGAGSDCHYLPELAPETPPQAVIYADFELSTSQFARRYTSMPPTEDVRREDIECYSFTDNFVRVELSGDSYSGIASDDFGQQSFADSVIADLEAQVKRYDAKVLIIDNITFMAQGTENACDALPLMRKLGDFKRRLGISVLVLAHTPKRNPSNPLNRNDLQGSKMIINFCDSAFAIGESSTGQGVRYIKQIKQRNTEEVYGARNVLQCTLGKLSDCFVGFRSERTTDENVHLKPRQGDGSVRRREEALALHAEGQSLDQIALRLNLSTRQVRRYLMDA